jgi:hypothetical protein
MEPEKFSRNICSEAYSNKVQKPQTRNNLEEVILLELGVMSLN